MRDLTQLLSSNVGPQHQHALHIIAVVLSQDRAGGHVCDVSQIDLPIRTAADRNILDFFERVHALRGQLHLNLVTDTAARVGPEIRDREAAR